MPRTAVVDRPDFHAWRAYRAVVDAETAAEQTAVFQFRSEGRGQHRQTRSPRARRVASGGPPASGVSPRQRAARQV